MWRYKMSTSEKNKKAASDAKSIYLGNLKTVEFDLKLPTSVNHESSISWHSSDDRWLSDNGKVTRPAYGRGNRTVTLTANVTNGESTVQREFLVTILQKGNDIKVAEVYPVELHVGINHPFYLPSAIAIRTDDDRVISHEVTWSKETSQKFETAGTYTVDGVLKDTKYSVTATISVDERPQTFQNLEKQVGLFDLQSVSLIGKTPFYRAQQHRLNFLLNVNDDQMLFNFRSAAGLSTLGAPEMIGWDAPNSLLRGHTTGHYLSALAKCFATTHNQQILRKLRYVISALNEVQIAFSKKSQYHDGFLSGYSEKQFDLLEEYKPYPEIWAPYYTLHKILAGLLDAYELTNNEEALQIAIGIGNWTYNRLSRLPHDQLVKMWGMYIAGEFGGMNDSLARLARFTNNDKFVECAKLFDNDKLQFPLLENIDALNGMHANQHIPQVIGWLEIYNITHEYKYYIAAKRFWDFVTAHHIYSIGGTGNGEMFHAPDAIASELGKDTAETCATYNLLKLTTLLYQYAPERQYLDYYEHATYNHILATTSDNDHGESTYFMPTDAGNRREFDDENSCCHGTGLENHFMYNSAIYLKQDNTLLISLLIDSILEDKNHHVEIQTESHGNQLKVSIKTTKLAEKSLAIRIPKWGKVSTASFNGERIKSDKGMITVPVTESENFLTFTLQKQIIEAFAPDSDNIFSVQYGPYIMAALLSDEEPFKLVKGTDNLSQNLKVKNNDGFTFKDQQFVPLFETGSNRYQLYFGC